MSNARSTCDKTWRKSLLYHLKKSFYERCASVFMINQYKGGDIADFTQTDVRTTKLRTTSIS